MLVEVIDFIQRLFVRLRSIIVFFLSGIFGIVDLYFGFLGLVVFLKARCISTVPIFSVPWAKATIGKASVSAKIVDRNFFIK